MQELNIYIGAGMCLLAFNEYNKKYLIKINEYICEKEFLNVKFLK